LKRQLTAILALAAATTVVACEAPTPSRPVDGNAGTLTWAVGAEKGELRLSRVENKLEGGVLRLKAWGDAAIPDPSGAPRVPVVLSGSLPVDRDVGADETGEFGMTASIPNASLDGDVTPMLKLVARDVDGVDAEWTCTVKSRREVVCNSVHVMPWMGAYPVPTGAFRAVFGFN
jgi:hypothetical protein